MCLAWSTQRDDVWSKRHQNIAIRMYSGIRFRMARKPTPLKDSRRNFRPPGGMWTNLLRPSQNTHVAVAISTPGTPNATHGPYAASSRGVSIVEKVDPRLMEK